MATAEHVLAEQPARVGDLDGPAQCRDRVGILAAQVDESAGRADGIRGNDHAFDEAERVTLDEHPVGERAAVTLVGVAAHPFLVAGRGADGLPLDPGGESGAAAAAQTRCGQLGDHVRGVHCQGTPESGQAVMVLVGREVGRLDPAHPGEGDSVLVAQPGIVVDDTDRRVAPGEDRVDIGGGEVGVTSASAVRCLDLGEWLQPEQAARAVAAHRRPRGSEGVGDLVRADGSGGCVDRHPDGRHCDHPAATCARRSEVSRP